MITLKPLEPNDVFGFYSWIKNPKAIKYSLSLFQNLSSSEQIDVWYQSVLDDVKTFNLGIYINSNQCVGYAGITNISNTNKSGEFFIFIGDEVAWGKGIGTEVTRQITALGFNKLNLNRIMLTVSEPNIGAVKAYEKAGFKHEGRLRESCYRDGAYHDKLIMSILSSEFKF